ncbi:hypothetical protein NEDG_01671 [Nematocida displodere]|uniref:Uncharacterized protein n=1 Tax=Nematocida displodere TaxID=1805483 RepID=A0A177EHA8_9MICR|nr:hypothetical protein NEDG_01671 [Nematocida displodere]
MSVCGVVKAIVLNQREGRPTKIQDLASALLLGRKECIDAVQMANEQLKGIGYEICPGSTPRLDHKGVPLEVDMQTSSYTHLLGSFAKCDFIFLIKTLECTPLENTNVNRDVEPIAILAMLIMLNGSDLEYTKALHSMEEVYPKDSEEILKRVLGQKYLRRYKRKEVQWVRLGWRFFFEFPEFAPEKILKKLQKAPMHQ